MPAPALTDAQIAALAGGGSSGPNTQIIQDGDGNYILVDKDTGKKTPIGIKGRPPADATKNRVLASGSSPSDKYIVTFDDQGNVQTVPNPNYVAPTKDTVPGSGTYDYGGSSQGGSDTSGPTYSGDQSVASYSAQTARAAQEETIRKNAADEADKAATRTRQEQLDYLKQLADQYNRDVANGDKTNPQAIAMFDAQVQMLTAGQSAGQDAVSNAKAMNANRVGPQFGQHFADALSGRGVNFTGADFSYPTPDYQAIAQKATAAMLAHLSPYAAQIAGTMAGPGGYGNGAYLGATGGGGAGASGSQATGGGVPTAPGLTRDAQGNLGWIGNDGRFVPAFTSPAPPQAGFMAQGSTVPLPGIPDPGYNPLNPGSGYSGAPRVVGGYRPGG